MCVRQTDHEHFAACSTVQFCASYTNKHRGYSEDCLIKTCPHSTFRYGRLEVIYQKVNSCITDVDSKYILAEVSQF